jgi:DUF2911 family protein
MNRSLVRCLFASSLVVLCALPATAQFGGLTVPPSGDNQYSAAVQGIGPVRLTIEYHSPDVHSPTGDDRRGKIWGGLVPFGMANLGFGTCGDQCPWRGGANENTVFTTSHDVKVQGQLLPAGSYGVHFIPGKEEWTIVFSKNHSAWGSFFYDPREDALRVTAKPAASEYHEWLTYEFTDRQTDHATLALKWEDLQLPFTIAVDNVAEVYLDAIRHELRSSPGFDWQNWVTAARYCLDHKVNLAEGLAWAEHAAHDPAIGKENFTTLAALADLQTANGKTAEAQKTMEVALNHRSAGPVDLHLYARQLQAQKKNDEAMKIFELNAKRYPDQWPVHLGLARGHAGLGHTKEALAEAKLALQQAPDAANRKNIEALIKQLEGTKATS